MQRDNCRTSSEVTRRLSCIVLLLGIVLCFILNLSPIAAAAATISFDSLEAWLELPKSTYLISESVVPYLFVVNHATKSQVLHYVGDRLGQPLRITVYRPDGSVFDKTGGSSNHDPCGRGRFAIDPGDTIVYWTEVWCDDELPSHTGCARPGEYTLAGTYLRDHLLAEVRFEVLAPPQAQTRPCDSTRIAYYRALEGASSSERRLEIMLEFYEAADNQVLKTFFATDAVQAFYRPQPPLDRLFEYVSRFLQEIDNVYVRVTCISLIWMNFGPDRVVSVLRELPQLTSDRYFRFILRHYLQYMRRTELYQRIYAPPSD